MSGLFPLAMLVRITLICALVAPCFAQVDTHQFQPASATLGASVAAIDDDRLVAGAPLDDAFAPGGGAVYLVDATQGSVLQAMAPAAPVAGQQFGFSVAATATTLVVGARGDSTLGAGAGCAYVFDLPSGTQRHQLFAPDGAAGDAFGTCVSIDGDHIVIGAPEDDDQGLASGSAYVFGAQSGAFQAKWLPADVAAGDRFGRALSIDGDLAVVTARFHDEGGMDAGSAYVYDLSSGQLVRELRPTDSGPHQVFGAAADVDGPHIVVGAIEDSEAGFQAGAAYVFDRASGAQLHKLLAADPEAGELLGFGVSARAGRAWIGASHHDQNTGRLIAFDLSSGQQLAVHTPAHAQTGAFCGLGLAHAGSWLACGAPGQPGGGALFLALDLPRIGQTTACPPVTNSTGGSARLGVARVGAAPELWLAAAGLPPQQFGYFLTSHMAGFVAQPGGSQGNLCLGGQIARYNAQVAAASPGGGLVVAVPTGSVPTSPPSAFAPGDSWTFQCWYRDCCPVPTSNFSDAVEVTF